MSARVQRHVDRTHAPFAGGAHGIPPGSSWNFQYWYRDPAGSLTTFSYSHAWNIVFAP